MPKGFSVSYRNPGHWDVYEASQRAFRIRGEPGHVMVFDEREDPSRPHPRPTETFKSVGTAMAWITDEYMTEGVPANG